LFRRLPSSRLCWPNTLHLSFAAVAEIRSALRTALEAMGGSIEEQREPGLPEDNRDFERALRAALKLLEPPAPFDLDAAAEGAG
jgi:hypothetical protein